MCTVLVLMPHRSGLRQNCLEQTLRPTYNECTGEHDGCFGDNDFNEGTTSWPTFLQHPVLLVMMLRIGARTRLVCVHFAFVPVFVWSRIVCSTIMRTANSMDDFGWGVGLEIVSTE